ncbi:MAG: polyisoprenoid-binding protein [Alphaproteobacteria bacterium]|nr:MAG: polyisoprenoid-binding protein [Alphaproteobacteria bacterium]
MKRFASLFVAAALSLSSIAYAKGSEKYIFDPAHTQILFSVNHLGFSYPHGRFNKFSGGFTFDLAHPEKSRVDITVDTNSIDMASEDWNRMMKGDNFFNVKKFPAMTFKSAKIETTGKNTGKVIGDLAILGVTKPVTLDVTYNKSGIHPYNKNYVAGFSATTKINRTDFGMTWGLPGIGEEVTVDIQVEGIRQDFEGLSKK